MRLSLNKVTEEKCRLAKELALEQEEENLLALLAKESAALEDLRGRVPQSAASSGGQGGKKVDKKVNVDKLPKKGKTRKPRSKGKKKKSKGFFKKRKEAAKKNTIM